MDSYSIQVRRTAEKELRILPRLDLMKVTDRIRARSKNPRPPSSEKLSDREQFRIRQGDYRIVYEIDDQQRIIHIIKIGNRKEVYRK